MNKKIILKIKQLLALAENNDNLNETLIAAETASRLMKQYNISKSALEADDKFLDYSVKMGKPWLNIKNPNEIIQSLATMIARQNNCECYLQRWFDDDNLEFTSLSVVGSPVDIIASEAIFWFVLSQLTRISNQENSQNKPSFWMGALQKLQERFANLEDDFSIVFRSNDARFGTQRSALQKINENKSKINEYVNALSRGQQKTILVDVKDFNLGYISANKIVTEKRIQLKE